MLRADKISLGSLVCSVALPLFSFVYLDQQIKGFNDRELLYSQTQSRSSETRSECKDWGAAGFGSDTDQQSSTTAPQERTAKPRKAVIKSSDACEEISAEERLSITVASVGKLPVSHISISISFQGTLPEDRFVSVEINPPLNVSKSRLPNGLVLTFDENLALSPGTSPISIEVRVTTVDQKKPTMASEFSFIGALIFSDGKNNLGLSGKTSSRRPANRR